MCNTASDTLQSLSASVCWSLGALAYSEGGLVPLPYQSSTFLQPAAGNEFSLRFFFDPQSLLTALATRGSVLVPRFLVSWSSFLILSARHVCGAAFERAVHISPCNPSMLKCLYYSYPCSMFLDPCSQSLFPIHVSQSTFLDPRS